MLPEPNLERLLAGIDFSGLDGPQESPKQEKEPVEVIAKEQTLEKKVQLQKIVSEIWVYTDLEGKSFAMSGIQNIHVLGEMTQEQALKIIRDGKNPPKGRKKEGS